MTFNAVKSSCGGNYLTLIVLMFQITYFPTDAHILVFRHTTNQLIEEYNDMPAQFGPSLPPNGLKTTAITANPLNGCTKIAPPPRNEDYPHCTAIIERGDCAFELKVRNAQAAKFDAVIIYNNNGDDLEQMSAQNATGIKIPSVFVGETAGANLRSLVKSGEIVLVINDELPFNINTQLILPFSILIGLCFLIMIFYMVYKCIREERRLRRYRLPKSMLKKLPIIKYTKSNHELLCENCVICLEDFVEGDKLRILPCSHPYHSHCIDPWLTEMRRVCPMCKRKVFTKGEARPNRSRQYSLDSITDTDDDTTPLLQNSTTAATDSSRSAGADLHVAAARASGRFLRAQAHRSGLSTIERGTTSRRNDSRRTVQVVEETSDDENVLEIDQPSANPGSSTRINPFDRQLNVQSTPAEPVNNESRSIWQQIFSRFFRGTSTGISAAAPPYLPEAPPQIAISSSEAMAAASLAAAAAVAAVASNNILNPNLSGSFQDDDDDQLTPHQCIYEPIDVPAPPPPQQQQQSYFTQTDDIFIETPRQSSGIGVVALPNINETFRDNHNERSQNRFLL